MPGVTVTQAASHLFTVNDECDKLAEETAQRFHTIVAKLLFVCKRSRPDIQVAVAFLTTRVISPDEDDWKKLGRVIKYLRYTVKMELLLSWDNKAVLNVAVDAAFAVHPNIMSHTGFTMTAGRGSFCSSSIKQKMNTRSSTEAELVGLDDALLQALWTRQFMLAQGYRLDEVVLHQDNLSTMQLATKGKASSSKRTRHLDIRFFFIKDKIDSGEVKLQYTTTLDLTSDYFTKPLQGTAFHKFRDKIMGKQ